jgi:hypothetical protein
MTSATLTACAAALAGLAFASAPLAAAQSDGYGEVGALCRGVIGLSPGEKHFAACIDSLTRSVRGLEHGRGLVVARRECLARGLQPDTGAFAECELTAERAEAQPGDGAVGGGPIPGGARDYFTISRETAYHRDELACARLGFDPDQPAFGDCVSDLKAALARASEPSM